MRFYTKQQSFSWDIDRHARILYVCMLHQDRAVVAHRHMPASPAALLAISTSLLLDVRCLAGIGILPGETSARDLGTHGIGSVACLQLWVPCLTITVPWQ